MSGLCAQATFTSTQKLSNLIEYTTNTTGDLQFLKRVLCDGTHQNIAKSSSTPNLSGVVLLFVCYLYFWGEWRLCLNQISENLNFTEIQSGFFTESRKCSRSAFYGLFKWCSSRIRKVSLLTHGSRGSTRREFWLVDGEWLPRSRLLRGNTATSYAHLALRE